MEHIERTGLHHDIRCLCNCLERSDLSGFEAGDTVAVFGAGPVGQMVTLSAMIRGASKVYVVDRIDQRLDLAASVGVIPPLT